MKTLVLLFFVLLFPFHLIAGEFDSFILTYQSVITSPKMVQVELVLDKPSENQIQQTLKKGIILKLSIENKIFEKRVLFTNKCISSVDMVYYLRYDPLTRQYTIMQEAQTIARNLDANFLLDIIIKHIKISIPTTLKEGEEYQLITKIDLSSSSTQPFTGSNLLFGSDRIIQPLEVKYDFTLSE